jgi:integrase
VDKNTKGKRAREVPVIDAIRDLVNRRMDLAGHDPDARLFTGPRGGRITTATLRDATSWDDVVTELGYEHLKRHGLRHTGADVDGRRRRTATQPPKDRGPRHPDDDPALPAPRPAVPYQRRGTALSALVVPKWSPTSRCSVG